MDLKRRLAYSIVKHLKDVSASGEHDEDVCESLEVAIQCLEQAYTINSEDASCVTDLDCGQSLLEIFSKATEPDEASVADKVQAVEHKLEGNDLMKTGKYNEAIEAYTRAIKLDATNSIYLSNRAAAYTKIGLNDKAIEDCNRAIEIDPNFSRTYGRLGLAYLNMENFEKAKESYEKGLSLDPSNVGYRSNLDLINDKLGMRKEPEGAPRAGGFPNLAGLDIGSLLSNPAVMNMAQSFMQNPQMQQMFSGMMGGGGQGGANAADDPSAAAGLSDFNMGNVFGATQQFAQQMQEENPELVEQLKSQFKNVKPDKDKDDKS